MSRPPSFVVDATSLKALSHPLRIRLLDELEVQGKATASGLAAALGESSGATSYHLRQLHRAGFVEELPSVGTARERWWQPRPGGWTLNMPSLSDGPAERALADTILQAILEHSERRFSEFINGFHHWPPEWQVLAQRLEWHMELNAAQVADLNAELVAVFEKYKTTAPGVGARRVHVNAVTFPAGAPPRTPSTSGDR